MYGPAIGTASEGGSIPACFQQDKGVISQRILGGSVAKTTKQAPGAEPKAAKKTTAGKKKVSKKVVAKKSPAKKAAVKKKTVVKQAAPKKAAAKKASPRKPAAKQISTQERYELIAQAAYFISESQGFAGDPKSDWVAAEAEVDARLAKAGIKVKG
jgi:hypothetical protein